jgi:hypothetical protein
MAVHSLSDHFARFFVTLNPSPTFEQRASAEHQAITALIENRAGGAGVLEPHCFLQGSYRQDTAIYTINDIDIVALCRAWFPGMPTLGAVEWPRDDIFYAVASAIAADARYADKVHYGPTSMVIHVDLDIKVEVLPVVFQGGVTDPSFEPFVLFRPERQQWEAGYARQHQRLLSLKNSALLAGGNFKPMIKVLKHLRSLHGVGAVSFHLECLLYSLPPIVFIGGPADYVTNVLTAIASTSADAWYQQTLMTPCGDRDIFTAEEWSYASWITFHAAVQKWLTAAGYAKMAPNKADAIEAWRLVLGEQFFPKTVTA